MRLSTCNLWLAVGFSIAVMHAAPVASADKQILIGNERRISFNEGWRFFKGAAACAEAPEFNDAQWRSLRLPHDWAIEGPFDEKYGANTGGLPIAGTGWYRKSFLLPAASQGRRFTIEFDGAMANVHVWLNGKELGTR